MSENSPPPEPPSRARKLRIWVAKRVPRGLRGSIMGMPEWGVRLAAVMVALFLLSSTVAFLRGVTGGMEFVNLALTDPMAALKHVGSSAKSSNQEALEAQAAEIAKIKLALAQLQSAQGGAPLADDSAARRNQAVGSLYTDDGDAGREAAAKLAAGDVKGAAEVLERAAQAETRGAAEKWRRIGALFYGVDNTRADRAYTAAYALDPMDYTTALELSRLRRLGLQPREAAKFASEAVALSGDPRERLVALTSRGQIQIALGALEAALRTQEEALAEADKLARANPNDETDFRNLAIAHHRVGEAQFELARGDLGKAQFERAYEMTVFAAKSKPGNIDAAGDVTYPAIKLGEIAVRQNELKEALTWFDNSLRILQKVAKVQPDRVDAQRNVAIAYQRLGNTLYHAEAADLALKDFTAALAIFEALHARAPDHRSAQHDLALARNKVGDALRKMKKFREARAMYDLALPVFFALANEPGAAPNLRRDLTVTYEKIGDAWSAENRYGEALSLYEKSLPIAEALAQDFPDNAQYADDVKVTIEQVRALRASVSRPATGPASVRQR